ncbi:hypothetical protein ABKN59_005095 [Abortiporus biennis]
MMYHDIDSELLRAFQLLHEIAEQNAHNAKMTSDLLGYSGALKTQAVEATSNFSLRRMNVDISKETFESELERTNAQVIIENHSLLYENRELSMLLKEYEQTMENIMSKFRRHAVAAQQHELTLTRHYEQLLQSRENIILQTDLSANPSVALSLDRLSHNLRALIHSMAGAFPEDNQQNSETSTSNENNSDNQQQQPRSDEELLDELLSDQNDWAHEREEEIDRLTKENEELRKLLGIDQSTAEANGWMQDEERELSYISRYTPMIHSHSSIVRSSSPGLMGGHPGLNRGGMNNNPSPQNSVPSPFINIPGAQALLNMSTNSNILGGGIGNGGNGGGGGGGIPSQIQVQISPAAGSIVGIPPRSDSLPTGMRGSQGRRSAMFGQRPRGGGPQLAGGRDVQFSQENQERPWQAQVGLDLS